MHHHAGELFQLRRQKGGQRVFIFTPISLGTHRQRDNRKNTEIMAATVDAKLLKSTKFPLEFNQKVDMQKVNLQVMKKYVLSLPLACPSCPGN